MAPLGMNSPRHEWPATHGVPRNTPHETRVQRTHFRNRAGAVVTVVDDDAEVREHLRAVVERRGLGFVAFADGESFLRSFGAERPGCVLLDARLDGISGLELQSELLARHITTPTIITTAYADVGLVVNAMRGGAFDVLEKPFHEHVLFAALRGAIAVDLRYRRRNAASEEIRQRFAHLTRREREVAELVVAGMPSRSIALMLAVGEKTIEVYRSRINSKMQARNSVELARMMAMVVHGVPWGTQRRRAAGRGSV